MRAEISNPVLQAASEVLESELGSPPQRGAIGLQRSAYTSDEVTAVVAVTGQIAGMVMFAMGASTARGMVSKMMGQHFAALDTLAHSRIAQLGNVLTGRTSCFLSDARFTPDL